MRRTLQVLLASVAIVRCGGAQVPSILFTGNHPFVGLDAASERPGGAINQLSEFGFHLTLPSSGASFARPLLPATAMQCYLGDGNYDGNFLKFDGWKTSYGQPLGIGGLFVQHADRNQVTWDKIYFSVRFGPGVVGREFEALVSGGIPYLVEPSDWLRLLPNGDSQWFLAPGQLLTAAGLQSGTGVLGAGALLQAANGDLYYSPSDGGHWVHGGQGPAQFAEDGAICKIAAAMITYDAAGNVAGIAPNAARLLINETIPGASSRSVRQWVLNAGAMDRLGAPLDSNDYQKTGGLAFDPAGGTWIPAFADASGNYPPEPNLIFCTESPEYGGTLFSTRNGGEVATLNSVLCGSVTTGQPADGSWLGVELDVANDQPSLLGMTLIGIPPLPQPFVADQAGFGAVPLASVQPLWHTDFFGEPGMPVLALIAAGPASGIYAQSLPASSLPFGFATDSWLDLFVASQPFVMTAVTIDAAGYATASVQNPNVAGLSGITVLVQGLGFGSGGLMVSSPVVSQLR